MKNKSAIIPYRFKGDHLEILLIKNSDNTKWIIPKGTIEKPLKPSVSATKEAYEEAGVLGIPHPILVGTYHKNCLLYTSPSPRDATLSRMPSSA